MSDSLQIFLRVKPSSTHSFPSPFHFPTPKTLLIPPNRLYPFDYIFPSSSSLSSLFHQTAEPLLQSFLSGYNATYFVFGQTGTGKTHTMGLLNKLSVESSGIVPETLRLLFIKLEDLVAPNSLKLEDSNSKQKNNPKSRNKPELYMTFFQIYKDEVRDLLNPEAKGLLIREIKDKNETYIQDLVETKVESLDTTIRLINAGLIFRKMGSQKMNQSSSRSHTILNFYLKKSNDFNQRTWLSFVDLAGSERVKKSSSKGDRLEEAITINSSLSSLANVISSLSSKNDSHVPFRNSKLTRVLQNSLSGTSKIVMLATINDSKEYLNESLCTLSFAMRCKGLVIKPIATIDLPNLSDEDQKSNIGISENSKKTNPSSYHTIEKTSVSNAKSDSKDDLIKKGEILSTFLIKVLKGFEKLIRKEGKTQREAFLNQEDLFEDLNLFSGKLKYNFSHEQGTLSHCFLNELDHLDEKYPFFLETGPRDQNFPREFNENQFENMDFDEILGKIQTLTDFIVKNLKGFCLKLEEIKKELLISQLLKRKREEELENWGLCLSFSLKSMIEKEKINQKLTIPQISPLELEQKTFEYHRGLIKEYEALLNRNSFYTDFDYFKEKIEAIKNKDFSHKIRDFSLMQSLKTLQKYSSNRVIRPNSPKETSNKSPDLKNSNFSPHRLESKFQFEDFEKKELELSLLDKKKKRKVQIPSKNKSSLKKNDPLISSPNELIKEIFKNEENYLRLDENKNNKIALDLSKIPPFQTSLPPKITINLNELSEIKKIKRQTTENLEKNIEETPKSMNLPYEEESKKESSNPVTPKLLIKLESPIENQEKDSFERNSQSIKSPPQKFLEDETFNEMKKITSTSPQNKDSLLMDPLAMKNSNDSSESLNLKKTKNIRNNTIKSISDKKIVLTRYNTLQSKGKESTNLNLGVMSPKSRFEDIRDKKKSEINNEESLLKFLDNKLEDF